MKASFFTSTLLGLTQAVLGVAISAENEIYASLLDARDEVDDIIDHVVFKRDDVLTPRDLELAEMHGVDINESKLVRPDKTQHFARGIRTKFFDLANLPPHLVYKHSVYKRSNGDDYTVWVHNSFNGTSEEDDEAVEDSGAVSGPLAARQERTRLRMTYASTSNGNHCRRQYIENTTHRNAATTGGANAIIRWGDRNSGRFFMAAGCCRNPKRVNLIIGGTNSGTNIRFGAGVHTSNANGWVMVGSKDIRHATAHARNNYRRDYGNGWRVQAHGAFRCDHDGWWGSPGAWVNFVLHRSVERV